MEAITNGSERRRAELTNTDRRARLRWCAGLSELADREYHNLEQSSAEIGHDEPLRRGLGRPRKLAQVLRQRYAAFDPGVERGRQSAITNGLYGDPGQVGYRAVALQQSRAANRAGGSNRAVGGRGDLATA
jgi:hypothetical protein